MAATEKVGIEVELLGGEEALALLKRIDNSIDTLNKRKKFRSLGGLNSAKAELESYISELQKLQKEEKKWQDLANKVGKKNMSAFGVREWDRTKAKIEETSAKIKKMGADMDEVTTKTRTFKQEFNAISSSVAHVGSAMQSLGNALVRLTSPMRRITSGILMGAGYKALNLFTEGLSNTFERSDTMRNYSRSLKALGLDVEQTFSIAGKEAKTAKDNLDDAVQGLPTSLDEIMAAQKVYAGATGEMVESTKTAIAANNAVIASSMGAREQRFMQKYLVALASGADLTTTQWDSMGRIAPLVMRSVAKELGYADDEFQQFNKDVRNGTVSGKEFLKAFQEVGISGVVANAARVATESWSGLASNIRIAVTRMGQGVIDTLNETFRDATGRTLLQTLLGIDAEGNKMGDGIRDWINNLSESIQNWIKANPDRIIDFFNTLKSVDWAGLMKGFGEGALQVLDLVQRFANWASGKDLSKVGKFMVWANVIGNGLLILGGALKGTRHIWGLLGALTKFAGKGGLIGGIMGGLFGTGGGGGAVGGMGGAIGAGIGKSTFMGIGKIGLVAAEITGIVGAISAMVAGFAALDMKLISSAVNSFREVMENLKSGLTTMSEIKAMDIDTAGIKNLVKKVAEVYQTMSGIPMSVSVTKRMASSAGHMRDAIFQLRRVAYQMNQAAGTDVDTGGFSAFVEQIRNAIYELQSLSGILELDIQVKLAPAFAASVTATTNTIKNAKKEIEKFKAPISYNIPVSVTFSVTTNALEAIRKIREDRARVRHAREGGNQQVYEAKGGMIYRAHGGGIPWKRRGTDTVPAMLTPGEYVHNRRAVSTFGIDFMRKVNNLDVKGAINELMHRAGHMANINRGTSITNNYNNNQKVVINNNGNAGAGYTFKRASRFVGAF